MDLQSTSSFIYGHISTMSSLLFPSQPLFFSPTYYPVHHLFLPMSSIPLIPPGLDIYGSKAPQCYAAAIATYLFAVIAVALRFWARRLMKAEIWVDDWTAAAALVGFQRRHSGSFVRQALTFLTRCWLLGPSLVQLSVRLPKNSVNEAIKKILKKGKTGLHQGFGQHFEVLGMDFASTFGKNFWTGELLYCLTIGLVKFSILAFYWRLFKVSIRIPVYVLRAVTICWEIGVVGDIFYPSISAWLTSAITKILATVFQCVPVSGFWNKTIHAKCVNPKHAFLGNSIPNIATDIALLLMPVPYIWRLHRTSSQKIVLTGIFMLGGL